MAEEDSPLFEESMWASILEGGCSLLGPGRISSQGAQRGKLQRELSCISQLQGDGKPCPLDDARPRQAAEGYKRSPEPGEDTIV